MTLGSHPFSSYPSLQGRCDSEMEEKRIRLQPALGPHWRAKQSNLNFKFKFYLKLLICLSVIMYLTFKYSLLLGHKINFVY